MSNGLKENLESLLPENNPLIPEIEQHYLLNNPIITKGLVRTGRLRWIVLHSPGVAQSNPYHIYKRWDKRNAGAAVHFILNDSQIIRLLPENCICWGTAKGQRGSINGTSIQIECCEPNGHKYRKTMGNKGFVLCTEIVDYDVEANKTYFEKMWTNATRLCYALCLAYGKRSKDIISHAEAAALGVASNHKDPDHWFKLHGRTMEDFRCAVESLLRK